MDLRYQSNSKHSTTFTGCFQFQNLNFYGHSRLSSVSTPTRHLHFRPGDRSTAERTETSKWGSSQQRAGGSQGWRTACGPAATEPSPEPGLHCGCCAEGKGSLRVCLCPCGAVRGKGQLEGRTGPLWAYRIAVLCLPQPPAWEAQLLLWVFLLCLLIHFHPHSCPCQEMHDFGQGCSAISGGTKSVSPALLGGTELLLAAASNNVCATDTVTAAF